jgi:site-specific recombinase XerD
MARRPKPWFRKDRKAWFVTVSGKRYNLGANKKVAFDRFYQLMRQPTPAAKVSIWSLPAIIDAFLEWTVHNRSAATYEWYRYQLQRFIEAYPDLRPQELRPFHVEEWVQSYVLSTTSRRNYLCSVKRCLRWAKRQGYIDSNPVAELEVPAGESREVYLAPSEFETFLSFARNDSLRALLVTTYECGWSR